MTISGLSWIPKGAAASKPKRLNMSQEEFDAISKEIGAEIMDARLAFEAASLEEKNDTKEARDDDRMDQEENPDELEQEKEGIEKYNLDAYDEDLPAGKAGIPVFGKTPGLVYHESNSEDPYIVVKDQQDEDEELEEMTIHDTDNMLIACKTSDEISQLEIYVYEEQENNLYVHHDILLPSFPLCVEWIDYTPTTGEAGSFVAVGTFDPQIEIWDLDTIDAIYPTAILGSTKSSRKKPSRKKASAGGGHTGPVSALSANKFNRNLLLSASIDTTVKLWDLNASDLGKAIRTFSHHTDKVCAVAWNPSQPPVFLSGGYDGVYALDSRYYYTLLQHYRSPSDYSSWTDLSSDVECVIWDNHNPERFIVSTENGEVKCFDARTTSSTPLFTLDAHDSAVSALSISKSIPGLLVTGGADRQTRVWDIREEGSKSCLGSRDLGVGKVFSAEFCGDGKRVSVGGSKGKLVVWNLCGNSAVSGAFDINFDGETADLAEVSDDDHESVEDSPDGVTAEEE